MSYLKTTQLLQNEVNTKKCLVCKKTGTFKEKSRTCEHCKEIKLLKKQQEKQLKTISKLERKKAKVVTVVKLSELKKAVQKKVNRFVRERDKNEPCISCNKPSEDKEAGHYIAQGSSGLLRFNLDNINGQCTSCNRWKHGNLLEYRIGLIRRIGEARVTWLEEHRHDQKHWTREDLEQVVNDLKGL